MILHYFIKKENKDKKIANKIYFSLIKFVKLVLSKNDLKIKKEFNSSFELMTIFLFTIFFSYKKKINNNHINQYLMDLYIIDLDKSLRELGIGDLRIGKYVKLYVKKIYYRIYKLEMIFKNKDFSEFEKYIEKINIQSQSNNLVFLSRYLFDVINSLLKRSKKEHLSEFTFNYTHN